jgi:RNA polymerase sigma-70 factor (ECF subfamily)
VVAGRPGPPALTAGGRERLRLDLPMGVGPTEAASAREAARFARLADQAQDSKLASEVKAHALGGRLDEARELFSVLVLRQQRRAARIAYHFLRDPSEVDEAVQDAFVRVFTHIGTYQDELPFDVWFTRILINGCLDRRKARRRRERWLAPVYELGPDEQPQVDQVPSRDPSPEEQLLSRERRARIARALERLPERQRTVLTLTLYDERSPREVSAITGLNQSTVRVHLFRALRKLRSLVEETP